VLTTVNLTLKSRVLGRAEVVRREARSCCVVSNEVYFLAAEHDNMVKLEIWQRKWPTRTYINPCISGHYFYSCMYSSYLASECTGSRVAQVDIMYNWYMNQCSNKSFNTVRREEYYLRVCVNMLYRGRDDIGWLLTKS
jgi:hypothetical protein